jgi:hypothetical protein
MSILLLSNIPCVITMDISKQVEINCIQWYELILVYVLHNEVMLIYYIDKITNTVISKQIF